MRRAILVLLVALLALVGCALDIPSPEETLCGWMVHERGSDELVNHAGENQCVKVWIVRGTATLADFDAPLCEAADLPRCVVGSAENIRLYTPTFKKDHGVHHAFADRNADGSCPLECD